MNTNLYTTIDQCRVCGRRPLSEVLDLGLQPPANSLRKDMNVPLPKIPLQICRCDNCTTIQLTTTVSPDYLFSEYVWVTGTSPSTREYGISFYQEIMKRLAVEEGFILEIASNDGTFLKVFQEHGHKVLGVDPAGNIARLTNDAGIPTKNMFFNAGVAEQIREQHGQADCVYARNVIPHVDDLHGVINGIFTCLKEGGVGAIEFHSAQIILDELHYDSIYHEHLCYHSLESMGHLLRGKGLYPFDLSTSPISGGSLVLYFSKKEKDPSTELKRKLESERQSGMTTQERWDGFAKRSLRHKKELKQIVDEELRCGSRIIGYGASARSSTLLNFCGLNREHLLCIADQNPLKHDTYAPGSDIPIVSPEKALGKNPDVVLLLAWNFKDEIISILKKTFKGKVIIPLPGSPRIIKLPGDNL